MVKTDVLTKYWADFGNTFQTRVAGLYQRFSTLAVATARALIQTRGRIITVVLPLERGALIRCGLDQLFGQHQIRGSHSTFVWPRLFSMLSFAKLLGVRWMYLAPLNETVWGLCSATINEASL